MKAAAPATASPEKRIADSAAPVGRGVLEVVALEVVAEAELRAAAVVVAAAVVEPPIGAVDAPAICDEMAGVKVPFIPLRVNRAENASAGNWGAEGSLKDTDS